MTDSRPRLVLHVLNRLDIGGLENGVVNLVNGLPADRYRHAIVCLSGYSDQFRKRIKVNGVDVVSLDKRPGKDVRVYGRMWHAIRARRPDIVHTRNLGTIDMQWIAAAAGVRRRIHGEHGWEAGDPKGLNPRNLKIRRCCRPVIDVFVPMSRDLGAWLEREVGVEPKRIRQLYNGVDTVRFFPLERAANAGELRIGTVGRLDPVKNHSELIKSFKALLDAHPEHVPRLKLVIVGDGALMGELRNLAEQLHVSDKVEFSGEHADTAPIMRTFDLFVLPSVNEGISNTILEAMASGLPVVAATVGGNPELVDAGRTGLLYDSDIPGALEAALWHYLADGELRRTHGSAGRERAVTRFSLDSMIDGYDALYQVCDRG